MFIDAFIDAFTEASLMMSHPLLRRFLPAFLAVLLLGGALWWLTNQAPAPATSLANATAPRQPATLVRIERGAKPVAEPPVPAPTAEHAPSPPSLPSPSAPTTPPAPAAPASPSPSPAPPSPPLPGAASYAPPPAPATPASESGGEGLKDKTGGWGKEIAKQLNRELMPLASECVELAQVRNPKLAGNLVVELTLAPMETPQGRAADRAFVEAVKPAANNEIHDAELLECLRQSSFALEDLKATYSFTLSIPIKAVVTLKVP